MLLPLLSSLALAACGSGDATPPPSPAEGVTQVQRQLLQSTTTDRAPGQTLELSRVIIPAGQEIAAHTHPGAQLAVIAEGTLTYTVLTGQVQVTRDAGSANAKAETVTAGRSVELRTGDTVVETVNMVHTAKNTTGGPVVIYLSSLFPEGAPASSPAQ